MRIITLFTVFLIGFAGTIFAQGCLPEGITFTTQEEIDSFQVNYPGCTEIEGDITISGNDITNLNGLSVITSIDGNLEIKFNQSLAGLTGLDNLIGIGGGFLLQDCDMITNLSGLEGLGVLGDYLAITANNLLTSLESLENLSAIGGNLNISGNNTLTNLTGLDNIDPNSIQILSIQWNDALTKCEVASVCNYLNNPNDTIIIQINAPGCDNLEEVEEACNAVSVQEKMKSDFFTVSPNPTTTDFVIEYTLLQNIPIIVRIIDVNGKVIKSVIKEKQLVGKHAIVIDAKEIERGVYFCLIETKKGVHVKKVIKM